MYAVSRVELSITERAFRGLASRRIAECVVWFPILVAVGVAILLVEYRAMLFAIIAFGISLIPLTYARKCWGEFRQRGDAQVTFDDGRVQFARGDELFSGSVTSAEHFPRFVRLMVNGHGALELPVRLQQRELLLNTLTGHGIDCTKGDGHYQILTMLAGILLIGAAGWLAIRLIFLGLLWLVFELGWL